MNEIEIINTEFVYPNYLFKYWFEHNIWSTIINKKNSELYHIVIESYIRKKYEDIWYLIPIKLIHGVDIGIFSDKNAIINQTNELIYKKFIGDAYRIILFYRMESVNEVKDYLSGRPLIFKDAFQGTEEERLKLNV